MSCGVMSRHRLPQPDMECFQKTLASLFLLYFNNCTNLLRVNKLQSSTCRILPMKFSWTIIISLFK
ncbi:hypothetical protein D3C75_545860 [compost metagenome]